MTNKTINALNVLDIRKLNYMPSHFVKMTLRTGRIDLVDRWVYQNLKSRYAIVKNLKLDSNDKMISVHELGVELPAELTILSLACPYLD
jgi:hypothetical protein